MTESQLAYREYLKSDHWRSLRLQAFRKWGRKCFKCPKTFGLDVHHLQYRHPWTLCTVEDVRPCCRECHENEHGIVKVLTLEAKTVQQRHEPHKRRFNSIRWKLSNRYGLSKTDRKFLNRQSNRGTPVNRALASELIGIALSFTGKLNPQPRRKKRRWKRGNGGVAKALREIRESRRHRYGW